MSHGFCLFVESAKAQSLVLTTLLAHFHTRPVTMMYTSSTYRPSLFKRIASTVPIASLLFIALSFSFLILTYISAISNIIHNFISVQSYSSLIFTSMTCIAVIPLFVFCLNAVIAENEFQLRLVLFIAVLMASISVVSVCQTLFRDRSLSSTEAMVHRIIMMTTCVVGVILVLLFLILSVPVSRSFGWKVFQRVGTRPDQIRRYKVYLWWDTVARGDLILVTVVLLLSVFFNGLRTLSYPALILLPILTLATIVAYPLVKKFGVHREISMVLLAYIAFSLLVPAYLTFKMITMVSENYVIPSWMPLDANEWTIDTNFTVIVMTITVVFSLLLRATLIIMSVFVWMNLGQGLRNIFVRDDDFVFSTRGLLKK